MVVSVDQTHRSSQEDCCLESEIETFINESADTAIKFVSLMLYVGYLLIEKVKTNLVYPLELY